ATRLFIRSKRHPPTVRIFGIADKQRSHYEKNHILSIKNFSSRFGVSVLVAGIIVFRFLYSITNEFWAKVDDVLQIYLIGLKSFTTHSHPYFGADLVYNQSQIPGALQGYLVLAGWYLWRIPEAPYILLNILLALSLGFLAWYA